VRPRPRSPQAAPEAVPARARAALVAAGLVLLVALVYGGVRDHAFVNFDDASYVAANPNVLSGLTGPGLRWAGTAFRNANWHPVTWVSHMADVEFFGPDPGAHHVVNAVLHAANAVLLFLVLRAATSALWPSAFVAALFAVHPLNVESVAWVSQRKSVLSTLFLLLTVGAHLSWVRRGGAGRRLLVALLLALGLLAKPMLVSVPLLLLLLDVWPLGRAGEGGPGLRKLIVEKMPLVALAAASILATLLAQSSGGAVASTAAYPLPERLANAAVSSVAYLRDAVWPANLACFYPHPASIGERTNPVTAIGAAALLLALSGLAVATRRRRPWRLFGWAWYLISLGPVIGLVQVGSQARADRYTYVPMIGIFVAVVWEMAALVRGHGVARKATAAAGAAAVAALAAGAFRQVRTWRDGESLYGHALLVTRNNWLASNNLGNLWLDRREPERALAAFREAVRIKPNYDQARFNEGLALEALDRPEEAARSFRECVRLDPGDADAWAHLGISGLVLGRPGEGLEACERALALRPDDALALHGATVACAEQGQDARALEYLARLTRVDPGKAAEVRRRLGPGAPRP
jgi:protein O-mannosyl-transferase